MSSQFLFINENIFGFNSGTEFSAINRQKLFKKNGLRSKIITRNFDTQLHRNILENGLEDNDLINMYDYFQKAINYKKSVNYLRYSKIIDKYNYKIKFVNADYSLIQKMGRTIAKANIFPRTFGEMGNIEYYDKFNNISHIDFYDYRGFKSKTQYMHPNGQVGNEIVYDINGKSVIEISHMNINDKVQPTMFKLLNYKNKKYRFNNENELFSFFLKEVAKPRNILINDRPSLIDAVSKMPKNVYKFEFLHNEHTVNPKETGNIDGELFGNLKSLFYDYKNIFNGIIVPTEKQKNDLKNRFKNLKIYNIFDFAINNRANINTNKLDNNITYMGRIFRDKNIEKMFKVISIVKNAIPNIHLDVMGYFESSSYKQELNNLINNLNIKNNVSFIGYKIGEEKSKQLNSTKMLIHTSLGEGLSMNLIEGLSYYLPEVAFDINYGPNEIIQNGVNGYLSTPNDINDMSQNIIKILQSDNLYKELSENAGKAVQKFNDKNIFSQWQSFLKQIN